MLYIILAAQDTFYLRSKELERSRLQSVLMNSKTPRLEFLPKFHFEPAGPRDVYESQPYWVGKLRLILLNELADKPHNASLKCFASRQT